MFSPFSFNVFLLCYWCSVVLTDVVSLLSDVVILSIPYVIFLCDVAVGLSIFSILFSVDQSHLPNVVVLVVCSKE